MQRKYVFFILIIMQLTGMFQENNPVNRDRNQGFGVIKAYAAETAGDYEERDCIYNVLFPANPKAYFDPENLSGEGQIFSDEFKVENYGNTDVAIRIKNIEVHYKSREEAYELSEEKVSDHHSDIKKIDVDVIWKNESENKEKVLDVSENVTDEYVLRLKAARYDENGNFVRQEDGSTGSFRFAGTLNSNRDLVWEDGEVQISFHYEIENIEKKKMLQEKEERQKDTEEKEPEQQENAVQPGLPDPDQETKSQGNPDAGEEEDQQEQTDAGNDGETSGEEGTIQQEEPETGQEVKQPEAGREEEQPEAGQEAEQPGTGRESGKEEEKQ